MPPTHDARSPSGPIPSVTNSDAGSLRPDSASGDTASEPSGGTVRAGIGVPSTSASRGSGSTAAIGYRIDAATGVCALTGRALADGEEYVAALVEVEPTPDAAGIETGLGRLDFSLAAWEAAPGRAAFTGMSGGRREITVSGIAHPVFASWRARRNVKASSRVMLVDDEALLELLEQLADQPERRRVAFRFVLALYLVRHRLLVLEGTGHHHSLLVRRRGDPTPAEGGPPLTEILNPELTDRDVVMVTEQLGEIMGGEWPQAEPPGERAAGSARVVSSRTVSVPSRGKA